MFEFINQDAVEAILPFILWGLGGALIGGAITAIVVSYLTRERAKEEAKNAPPLPSETISEMARERLKNKDYKKTDIGLGKLLHGAIEDEEGDVIVFEAKNGQVTKMEKIEAEEIEESLAEDLEKEEIVIL